MTGTSPFPWHGEAHPGRPVLVGVVPGHTPAVVRHAAELAADLGVPLVCLWSDGSRVPGPVGPDGERTTAPLDPDQVDDGLAARRAEELHGHLAAVLADLPVAWRLLVAVGEPARALAVVADQVDARLVVVGTRRHGLAGWMGAALAGSVAGHLTHTQARPVVVVPREPARDR